jgi:hypothetical protein
MPEELERELERALGALPGPSAEAGERARRAALDALPAVDPGRRRWRAPAMLAAAATVVLAAAVGVTLAATGTPPFAPARHHPPARPVPNTSTTNVPGVLATYVDGRLWLGRTHGHRFSAVELSPGGLYLAVGAPGRLAVYTPDLSRRVWTYPVHGSVVAISWRPIGTQIAYIVRTGGHNVLHLIQADGDTDQVVDAAVAPVTPSWRWDSQAFAYVGAGGQVAVRDLIHDRSAPIKAPRDCPSGGGTSSVAFAPVGAHRAWLVAAFRDGNGLAVNTATGIATCFGSPGAVGIPGPPLLAWTPHGELLAAADQDIVRLRVARGQLVDDGVAIASKGIAGVVASPDGRGMLVALIGSSELSEVFARLPPTTGQQPLLITGRLPSLPVAPPRNYRPQLFWR